MRVHSRDLFDRGDVPFASLFDDGSELPFHSYAPQQQFITIGSVFRGVAFRAVLETWTGRKPSAIIPGTVPETGQGKHDHRSERLLGGYLFALCLYQIGIYCWPSGPPFILDPRAGIPVLLINHFSLDNKVIFPVEWISATWLVLAAAMIFFRGRLLKPYVIVEFVLAAPTAYYIGVLAIRHGGDFAPAFVDLVVTVTLFLIFSAIPVVLAASRILARGRTRTGSVPN